MKTLGRTLLILAVFTLLMGAIYVAVNASGVSSSASSTQFDRQFPDGENRPEFGEGQRPPQFENGERGGFGGLGWVFGLIKNTAVIGIIVALVMVPKNLLRKNKPTAPVVSE